MLLRLRMFVAEYPELSILIGLISVVTVALIVYAFLNLILGFVRGPRE